MSTPAALRASPLFIGFAGDSFNNEPVSPNTYPELLSAALGATYRNIGINGAFAALQHKGVAAGLGAYGRAGVTTVAHILEGTNDTALGAAASVYESKVLMAERLRDPAGDGTLPGFDFIVTGTILPSQHFTGPQETARQAANAELLADAEDAFDLILDWQALDSGFDNYAGAYYHTAVVVTHWSAAGSARAVELAVPRISALLPIP